MAHVFGYVKPRFLVTYMLYLGNFFFFFFVLKPTKKILLYPDEIL